LPSQVLFWWTGEREALPPGMQRVMSKRMKTIELLAFLRVACLLAVEKDGMVRVAVRRGRPKSKNASKLLAADGMNHSIT